MILISIAAVSTK